MFGETFKQLRVDRGMTIEAVADGIISIAVVSRFENGKTDLKMSVLAALLDRLDVQFSEYARMVERNDARYGSWAYQIARAYDEENRPALRQLFDARHAQYVSDGGLQTLFDAAAAANYYRDLGGEQLLSEQELTLITETFADLKLWAGIDVARFGNTLWLLPPRQTYNLAVRLLNGLDQTRRTSASAYKDAWMVLTNALLVLMCSDLPRAQKLDDKLAGVVPARNLLYARLRRQFFRQLLQFRLSGQGERAMQATLDFLQQNDNTAIAADLAAARTRVSASR